MQESRFKISYVKKPYAKNSWVCLAGAAAAAVFATISLQISVRLQGNGGMNVAAWGISSLIFSIVGLIYGLLSLREKEKNYRLSKIGMVISGILLLFWICLLIVGLRG